MAFLFKSKKQQPPASALPAASRNITSSDGPPPASSIPTANGARAGPPPREAEPARNSPQAQTPTPTASVNNSVSSLQGTEHTASPEPTKLRERSNSQLQNGRASQAPPPRGLSESPYPWSQRRLNFTTAASPFPRYGAAVNSLASKDGSIYLMGGLVNGTTVKGDLWMTEAGAGNMACHPVATTSEGPGPRVGHASLLVGNAFIVFGGDTKLDEGDLLDDTLYLLNTSTKQWSRALPAGPRPSGRYGHTLNILGSRIYIFGGQVEGFFFNDLVAFDLNALQVPNNRWEVLIPNSADGGPAPGHVPPARTNHSIVNWNDKLYLFGGTDGVNWFSDVWAYDPKTNSWSELDCIGYIPLAREGHAAAIVQDTMYVFGGRTREGTDLGDLAAFKITSRRWYMFQNMGPSPSPRSGHSMTAYGKHIVVLAGEPSSSAPDRNELSMAYVLDTSKIRYPSSEQSPATAVERQPVRKMSGGGSGIPQSRAGRESMMAGPMGAPPARPAEGPPVAGSPQNSPGGSRLPLPRTVGGPVASSGPPPQQQAPQPRANGARPGSKTPTKASGFGPTVDTARAAALDRDAMSPVARESPVARDSPSMRENEPQSVAQRAMQNQGREQSPRGVRSPVQAKPPHLHKDSVDSVKSGPPPRSESRSRHQQSLDNVVQDSPRGSSEGHKHRRSASREVEKPIDSGMGSSPSGKAPSEEVVRELEAARSRNAWLASELALARKAGYQANASNSPVLDERAAEAFGDDDKPLVEALIRMRAELAKVQNSIDAQAVEAANKIAQIERQRDAAIGEAVYAKTKLAAHGGSQAGTPQPDGNRNMTPDMDRMNDMNRRLAASLAAQTELSSRVDGLLVEMESEKRARTLAEETAEAAQKRASDLDSYRQRTMMELESLRAELHEAEKAAREESASSAEAKASAQMLTIDKSELSGKLSRALDDVKNHSGVLESLRAAVNASTDKAALLESKLDDERTLRSELEQQFAKIRAEHEDSKRELESTARRLKDSEEIAAKHAEEAAMHREAVLNGLARATDKDTDEDVSDQRVQILQQQLDAASAMVRKNQEAADLASEKLRRAEERIAGLETFQEQASREGLSIRKQLQNAMREMQQLQSDKSELQQQYERQLLEANAHEVQLKTLKNLLDERGISTSAAEHRRSRALDSPSSRFSTPELNRVRELEQQLDASLKAHDEMRASFENREAEISKEWEEKITALHNDHQAAVKYLRGTEKMLTKMKSELERYKATNGELEKELSQARQRGLSPNQDANSNWEAERDALRSQITNMQGTLKESVTQLESQIQQLQTDLEAARVEQESAARQAQQLEHVSAQQRAEMESLQREKVSLEERARDAEQRVQMFLDQFENSVDNYRRQSQMVLQPHGHDDHSHGHSHHRSHGSIAGDSIYSQATDTTERTVTPPNPQAAAAATRNSMALDSLATELESLRSHWESTNKAYRLSQHSYIDRTPTTEQADIGESLGSWRKRLDLDDEDEDEDDHPTPQYASTPSSSQHAKQPSPAMQGGLERNGSDDANSRTPTLATMNGVSPGSPTGPGPGGAAMI
ncbi:cell polarity protein [Diplodia corticola]|uniref:Cell polarity protein n=1 Tax=Diplodia corticola TaxID=236234 RepID=A0A1J9QY05_9PEZI|nr:cell polarity protein [Diplodia corticola]OJD33926.1 cell polarity protein [Diplodia corticola]